MSSAPRLAHLSCLALLGLAACGGGSSTPQQAPGRALSGTITAAGGQVADGDVADPNSPRTPNDDPATAQVIPNAVTVGGHVGPTDDTDAFKVRLVAGQTIALALSEPVTADLDLYLFRQSDVVTPVASSEGAPPTAVEAITVAATDDYYVVVATVPLAAGGPVFESGYLLTIGTAPAAAPGSLSVAREFVPGEVLVRFRPSQLGLAGAGDLQARASALGLAVLGGAPGREVHLSLGDGSEAGRATALRALGAPAARVAGPWGRLPDAVTAAKLDTIAAIKALRGRADVETADPNYVFHPAAVPGDPAYRFQWHYPLLNLPQAWDVTTGSAGVIVAVLDTGVYLAHPDLAPNLVAGYDFIASPTVARDGTGRDADPDDPGDSAAPGQSSFHGTHVAGTIAAASDNGAGVAGVAWGTRLMPLRVLGAGGGTSADILQGLRYAAGLAGDLHGETAQPRAAVANLSLGCLDCFSATEQAVYGLARQKGLIVVAAAGNENSPLLGYPASYDGVISVAAVDIASARAPYSNFNASVDVAAPGGNTAADRNGDGYVDGVLSTVADDSSGARAPAYGFLQGTSMASPHVAGVVALMKANCPTLTPASLDALLASGAITSDLGAAGRDASFGHGLVDAFRAVTACAGAAAPAALGVSPGRLDAATAAGPFSLTAANAGEGALATVSAAVTAGADWLAVAPPAGATGLGAYTVTITRGALPAGSYAGAVTFTAGAQSVAVPVTMRVGAVAASTGVGHVYVLLLDDGGTPVLQDDAPSVGGSYAYGFAGVPDGTYAVVAGTDLDDDGFICDAGEACGAWPTLGVPTPIEVTGDEAGLDFGVGFEVGVGGLSAGQAAAPSGWRRLPAAQAPKALGGGR